MMEQLDVYLCDHLAGILSRSDGGNLSFRYLPEYLKGNAIPLSATLPLDAEPFTERDISRLYVMFGPKRIEKPTKVVRQPLP